MVLPCTVRFTCRSYPTLFYWSLSIISQWKFWISITKSDLTGYVFVVVVVKMFTHEPSTRCNNVCGTTTQSYQLTLSIFSLTWTGRVVIPTILKCVWLRQTDRWKTQKIIRHWPTNFMENFAPLFACTSFKILSRSLGLSQQISINFCYWGGLVF